MYNIDKIALKMNNMTFSPYAYMCVGIYMCGCGYIYTYHINTEYILFIINSKNILL